MTKKTFLIGSIILLLNCLLIPYSFADQCPIQADTAGWRCFGYSGISRHTFVSAEWQGYIRCNYWDGLHALFCQSEAVYPEPKGINWQGSECNQPGNPENCNFSKNDLF